MAESYQDVVVSIMLAGWLDSVAIYKFRHLETGPGSLKIGAKATDHRPSTPVGD
jgi:hypothetical protein